MKVSCLLSWPVLLLLLHSHWWARMVVVNAQGQIRAASHDELVAQDSNFTPKSTSNITLYDNINQISSLSVKQPIITHQTDVEVTLEWTCDVSISSLRTPRLFVVELAKGQYSEDFLAIEQLDIRLDTMQGSLIVQTYLLKDLQPKTWYRLRVVPVFSMGPDLPSPPIAFETLRSAINYWEPIISRRFSRLAFGRGFSDPTADRPHLSPGVEIFAKHARAAEEALWFSDSPTRETPLLPTGRRGHSLTLIDDSIFMFGGRTNGYSCASTVKDTLDLGNYDSGRTIYPCVKMNAEVNEIWKLDLNTFEWQFINTTLYDYMNPNFNRSNHRPVSPPNREQHSAALLLGNLFVFGGKSRMHDVDSLGQPILTNKSDVVYNDLWTLQVVHEKSSSFIWHNYSINYSTDLYDDIYGKVSYEQNFNVSAAHMQTIIRQDQRNYFEIDTYPIVNQRKNAHNQTEGDSPRYGQCIRDVTINVREFRWIWCRFIVFMWLSIRFDCDILA
jgi:hypothetical protein